MPGMGGYNLIIVLYYYYNQLIDRQMPKAKVGIKQYAFGCVHNFFKIN